MHLEQPVGRHADTELVQLLPDENVADSAVRTDQSALRERVDEALKRLSFREREIIKLRFGLGDGYNYTLGEIGYIFGITRERVRQLEKRALEKLQDPRQSSELVEFLD
jgi:RNA polymerase primary sigma factor